jgi:hypothetical protein
MQDEKGCAEIGREVGGWGARKGIRKGWENFDRYK